MSDVAKKNEPAPEELRVVGFLCNWCSYGGADTAGVARFKQPTDLRIIRVPCSGRVDPLFIVKALLNGADGVLVSGCHPRDCHYTDGNFYARRRLEMLKRFLPFMGIDEKRFHYTWISASEGQRWQQTVTDFTKQIHELGPLHTIAGASVAPSSGSATGASPSMADSQRGSR
jgi:F420-non-reducing hydrogenase iron-sulfur subunit